MVDNKTETLEIVPLTSKLGRGAFSVMACEIAVVVSVCLGPILGSRCLKFILKEILSLGKVKCTSLLGMKMTRKMSCPGVHRLHLAYAERSFPSENVMEVFASGLACGGD